MCLYSSNPVHASGNLEITHQQCAAAAAPRDIINTCVDILVQAFEIVGSGHSVSFFAYRKHSGKSNLINNKCLSLRTETVYIANVQTKASMAVS